jgi:large subunit ribosomal protein L24
MMTRKIRKDDFVVVISGDHRHLPYEKRVGKVKLIDRKKNRIIVEGINTRKVSRKRSSQNPQGGYVDKECSIHISNVMHKDKYEAKRQATTER